MSIDDISQTLGALKADNESAKKQRGEIFDQLKQINSVCATIPILVESIKDHKDEIERLKTFRNRALGMLTGASVFAGGAGAVVSKFLTKL